MLKLVTSSFKAIRLATTTPHRLQLKVGVGLEWPYKMTQHCYCDVLDLLHSSEDVVSGFSRLYIMLG